MTPIRASGTRGRRSLLTASAATVAVAVTGMGAPAHATRGDREQRNKRRVASVFRRAAERGTLGRDNGFYLDILHPDVVWTVASSSPRVYSSRADFLARGSAPIIDRLATPIHPTVRGLYADGDVVVVVWDGTATALDGQPYVNSYTWIFTMRGRRAIRVEAFLDVVAINELVARVALPPPEG